MYRPWYQFTTGYVWVLQGTESQQHVQTLIPVHYRVRMGTSRHWKPTACTDLDASALEDWAYAVGHQEQVASLGRHEGQILSSQLQGDKNNQQITVSSFSVFFCCGWTSEPKLVIIQTPPPLFQFFFLSISRMHQTLHPTINCLYQRKLPECAAIITKTFITFSASPPTRPPPPPRKRRKKGRCLRFFRERQTETETETGETDWWLQFSPERVQRLPAVHHHASQNVWSRTTAAQACAHRQDPAWPWAELWCGPDTPLFPTAATIIQICSSQAGVQVDQCWDFNPFTLQCLLCRQSENDQ